MFFWAFSGFQPSVKTSQPSQTVISPAAIAGARISSIPLQQEHRVRVAGVALDDRVDALGLGRKDRRACIRPTSTLSNDR